MVDKFEEIKAALKEQKKIAVYGAGVVAYNISLAIMTLFDIEKIYYFVTNIEEGNNGICGIVQAELFSEKKMEEYGNPLIVVATPGEYHEEISEKLTQAGVKGFFLIDSDLEYEFMSRFFRIKKGFIMVEDLLHSHEEVGKDTVEGFKIYMARSVHDKVLKKKYFIPAWIIPVQAGKADTCQKIEDQTDDFNGGISLRNRNYSELTVTYWAWKMKKVDYKGICHYRRIFRFSESDINSILKNDVDVVLPLPFMCYPDASGQYFRYIHKKDFEIFMQIMGDLFPEDIESIKEILKYDYLYNYNMLIAKNEIFNRYCEFMFTALFQLEQYYCERGIQRRDRYLGYFGELLTSIFFTLNAKRLRVVHAKRNWLI